jgi:two-component system, OmpR family, response regulator CpxR
VQETAIASIATKATVLVVDDDNAILDALADVLRDEGYEVVCAHNGDEGLRYLKSAPAAPHAIVLDLFMPLTNGWEFVEEVRKSARYSDIPIIMVTAVEPHWGYPVDRARVLRKPFRTERLLHLLREVATVDPQPS